MRWGIWLNDGPDELIGMISVWPDDGDRDQRSLWLDPEFWRRGIVTEAVDCITDYAFSELGYAHLYLSNAEPNVGSRRIKEKQGAELIDTVPCQFIGGEFPRQIWLLTAENWFACRP